MAITPLLISASLGFSPASQPCPSMPKRLVAGEQCPSRKMAGFTVLMGGRFGEQEWKPARIAVTSASQSQARERCRQPPRWL